MGRRAMSETPITTAEITRTKFPSPFREQGEAKVYKHQIDIETHVDHSLPFGIMKRKFNSTEQVFKRQGVTDVTTTYKHCPCDFFAAVGGIVGFVPPLVPEPLRLALAVALSLAPLEGQLSQRWLLMESASWH